MISSWTAGFTDEEKIRFERTIQSAKPVLDRQSEILIKMLETLNASETTIKSYESPSWGYLQAHKNGYRAAMSDVLKLINLDQKEHK